MKTQHLLFVGMIAVVGMIVYYTLSTAQTDDAYTQDIKAFREDRNRYFAEDEDSPLDKAQREVFDSLSYFSPNPAYRVVADLEWIRSAPVFSLPTSQEGKTQKYKRAAWASFKLGGKEHKLILLEMTGPNDDGKLHLLFRDETSGKETYGAGRYIDIENKRKKTCMIDFNKAYNPYCAYNEYYVCPMPPPENQLSVRVEAGEKKPTFMAEKS